jgi:ribosomal protein S18 acetylase RimI-like enzyme
VDSQQLTLIAQIEDILKHQPQLACVGETLPLNPVHGEAWIDLYRASYTTSYAFSHEEAVEEWRVTLASEYGVVWPEASPQFFVAGRLVGSLMTVRQAPWNNVPSGPFIIELVVEPGFRGNGIASWLLQQVAEILHQNKQQTVALRVMANNLSALRLYTKTGFTLWQPGESAP